MACIPERRSFPEPVPSLCDEPEGMVTAPREGPYLAITRLWRFHAGNGLTSLAGNTVLTYCLVDRLRVPVLPSAMGAIVICSLINFFIADRWVYTTT
jgi:hypothetical protein